MMLSHYLHLMTYEGEVFDQKMIIRGSLERLVPVLMTGLTTGLALIPARLFRRSDRAAKSCSRSPS